MDIQNKKDSKRTQTYAYSIIILNYATFIKATKNNVIIYTVYVFQSRMLLAILMRVVAKKYYS